jgi:hypothetical protein
MHTIKIRGIKIESSDQYSHIKKYIYLNISLTIYLVQYINTDTNHYMRDKLPTKHMVTVTSMRSSSIIFAQACRRWL